MFTLLVQPQAIDLFPNPLVQSSTVFLPGVRGLDHGWAAMPAGIRTASVVPRR